ncbi:proteasome activator complex subunit 1 isoform X4 [Gallus gallus]|uniref:proteasome activator complex subunit 1 isoform X4 n=1 Tax=Gallus gallus TaxID=9031 RepID=UPI001AE44223|nr:proteasome activator complex subunit 1 isoform X4 [Gallus gallus]
MESLRYGAAVGLRYGAAVGRICGAAAWGLSYGAAVILGSPTFPRAHVLLVALLVGLRCGAAPQRAPASPHNLLEARLLPSVGRWTSLLVGSLLIASLPLVRPASARWGALFRAAARCAVTSAIMAAAAPPLFASIRSAVGLSPSPHAFALVLCGLAMGEELGPLGRLLHPPHAGSDVRSRSGALPVGSVADVTAAPGPGWKALGAVWVVFKMAAGWGGKMAARGGAVLFKMAAAAASRWGGGGRGGGGKMAAAGGTEKTGEGGRRTAGTGSGVAESGRSAAELRAGMTEWRRWRDGNGSGEPETGSGATTTGSGLLSARGETFGTGSGLLRAPGQSAG